MTHVPSVHSSPWPSRSAEANSPYLLGFVSCLFLAMAVLRFLVGQQPPEHHDELHRRRRLDDEKLRFTTYGLLATTMLTVLSLRIELTRWELDAVKGPAGA